MKLKKINNPVHAMLKQLQGKLVLAELNGSTYLCQCESGQVSLNQAQASLTTGEISSDELAQIKVTFTNLRDANDTLLAAPLTATKAYFELEASPAKAKKQRPVKEKKIRMSAGVINPDTLSDELIWGDFMESTSPTPLSA